MHSYFFTNVFVLKSGWNSFKSKVVINIAMKILLVILFVMGTKGAHEGDPCINEGVTGVCTNIKKCRAALEDISNGKQPQLCGVGGIDPTVCCVPPASLSEGTALPRTKRATASASTEIPSYDDYVDVDPRASSDGCKPQPPDRTAPPTGQKAWDKCIEYQEKLIYPCIKNTALTGGFVRADRCHHNADELIIGGEAAGTNEFPHMALLGYTDESSQLHWLCGGSLISENFVLTAGHCTSTKERWDVSHVQLGAPRRATISEKNRYRVKNIIKHPKYAPPNKYHDIALLELEKPVPLDEFTVPACVHTGEPVDDSRASVTGWGLTSKNGNTSDALQKVILTKFDDLLCAVKFMPGVRYMKDGFDETTQVCYGDFTKSKDTCQGDSGGPLQIKNNKIYCMYTIMGVTSFGDECGFVGVPAVYTRVAHYLDWIEKTVWP